MNYNHRESCARMMAKSHASLASARADLDAKRSVDRAVSSLYFAAFQSVVALLMIREVKSSTHRFVRQYVNKVLVLEEKFPVQLARMYNKLMEIRDEADYSPEESCTIQEAEQFYAKVSEFIEAISARIESEK